MHGSTILIHFPFLCKKIRFLIFPTQARVLVSKGVKFWVISRPKNLTHFWANKSNSVPYLRVCFFFANYGSAWNIVHQGWLFRPAPGSRILESLLYHILSLSVSSSEQIALEITTTSPEIISITSPLVCEYISGHLSRIILATFTACATVIDIGSGVCHIESFRVSKFSFFFLVLRPLYFNLP